MDLLVSTVGMTAGNDDWHSCLRLVRDRDCAAGRSTPNGARLSHGTLLPDNVIERAILLLVRFSNRLSICNFMRTIAAAEPMEAADLAT
jgi:hypothetical protein